MIPRRLGKGQVIPTNTPSPNYWFFSPRRSGKHLMLAWRRFSGSYKFKTPRRFSRSWRTSPDLLVRQGLLLVLNWNVIRRSRRPLQNTLKSFLETGKTITSKPKMKNMKFHPAWLILEKETWWQYKRSPVMTRQWQDFQLTHRNMYRYLVKVVPRSINRRIWLVSMYSCHYRK